MKVKCHAVVKGPKPFSGEALVFKGPLSFMGEVDMMTGKLIAHAQEHYGASVAGKILIYPEAKGSSGGCFVLRSLAAHGKTPSAIVNIACVDYNLVEGAILAKIPLLSKPNKDLLALVKTGDRLEVDPLKGTLLLNTP